MWLVDYVKTNFLPVGKLLYSTGMNAYGAVKDVTSKPKAKTEDASSLNDMINLGLDKGSEILYQILERNDRMGNSTDLINSVSENLPTFTSMEQIEFKRAELELENDIRTRNSELVLDIRRQTHSRFLAYICTGTICSIPVLIIMAITIIGAMDGKVLDIANAFAAQTGLLATLTVTLAAVIGFYLKSTSNAVVKDTPPAIVTGKIVPENKLPSEVVESIKDANTQKAKTGTKTKKASGEVMARGDKIEPNEPIGPDDLP